MDHHRVQRRSLRDVLVAQGTLTTDQADELMSAARDAHESFAAVLVESGHVSAYELCRTVSAHFQMPVLPLAGYDFDRLIVKGLPPATLYQYLAVPVGRFGETWSFAVIEPPSRDALDALKEVCGTRLVFFVAEVTEVQRLLREYVKVVDTSADPSWQSIFDTADQNILGEADGILEGLE